MQYNIIMPPSVKVAGYEKATHAASPLKWCEDHECWYCNRPAEQNNTRRYTHSPSSCEVEQKHLNLTKVIPAFISLLPFDFQSSLFISKGVSTYISFRFILANASGIAVDPVLTAVQLGRLKSDGVRGNSAEVSDLWTEVCHEICAPFVFFSTVFMFSTNANWSFIQFGSIWRCDRW